LGLRISLRKVSTDLVSQFPDFPHPLFVHTYLGECTAFDLMRELYNIHLLLAGAESRTRFGDWDVLDAGSEAASPDDGENNDYEKEDSVVAAAAGVPSLDALDHVDGEGEGEVAAVGIESRY
jgi:hypothetical protein